MIFIKYINVNLNVNKIIPVDEDNIDLAIKKAQDIFSEYENSDEYFQERRVTFEENIAVASMADTVAFNIHNTYFEENITREDVKACVYQLFLKDNFSECVYEETLNILQNKYNRSFEDISI